MSTFLALPRELRDRIIEFAIVHHAIAPEIPEKAGNQTELHDIDYFSPTGGRSVFYTTPLPSTSPFGLLSTNHQIRSETVDAINRLNLSLTTKCDVLIVAEEHLYVTWTYVPPIFEAHPLFPLLSSQGNTGLFGVEFTIRSHGIFNPTDTNPNSGFEDLVEGPNEDITGPGTVISGFCALFERYLRVGSGNYPAPSKDFDRQHPVRFAFLNVLTPPNAEVDGLLPDDLGPHYARQTRMHTQEAGGTGREMISPKALLETLMNWFWASDLFEKRESGPRHLGELLERVGGLGSALDGEVKTRLSNATLDGTWEDVV